MSDSREIRGYTIKLADDLDFIPGFMVLKIGNKYYNFERTMRTHESVYNEVKDKLYTLNYLNDEDLKSIDIEDYFVTSFLP